MANQDIITDVLTEQVIEHDTECAMFCHPCISTNSETTTKTETETTSKVNQQPENNNSRQNSRQNIDLIETNETIDIYEPKEDIALSTKYYRRNKLSRDKVHKCPHCDYETTGPKQTLINHIKAKHTAEKDKPYYCSCCNKGFAQAANYEKHMIRFHGKEIKVTKTREERRPFVYAIKMGDKEPTSKNTRARYAYYLTNKYIRASELGTIKYSETKVLSQKDLHYDKKNSYISFTVYTKDEFDNYIKLLKKLNNTKKNKKVKAMQ